MPSEDRSKVVIPPELNLATLEPVNRNQIIQLTDELDRRSATALTMYTPMHEDQRKFHESDCPERIAIGSNRGGKTLTATIEVARFALNQDTIKPHTNEKLGDKEQSDRRIIIVGRDSEHLAQVQYRKLCRAGAFRMKRNETGRWVSANPEEDPDGTTTKPAPPILPPSAIDVIAWENKNQSVPRRIRLKNGTEIGFYTGAGFPPMGQDVDLVWFDEEITNVNWYPEMSARLLDRHGKFIWSATPQTATEALFDLSERSDQEEEDGKDLRTCEKYFFHIEANPHIDVSQKKLFYQKLTPEERAVRYHGEFKIKTHRVYPEFDVGLHGIRHEDLPESQVPEKWTKYLFVDPGRQVSATLFVAIPPDNLHAYIYDEIYLHNATAALWAEQVRSRSVGVEYASFIMDFQFGRQSHAGTGRTIESHYSEALKDVGISSWLSGHAFEWGATDVVSGLEAVRKWLYIRPEGPGTGSPFLQVVLEKCPCFLREISKYNYKRESDGTIQDKPNDRKANHLMDCLRYAAMHRPTWRPRPSSAKPREPTLQYLQNKMKRHTDGVSSTIMLGPGSTY
jgi:hypothetical protein